MTIECAILGLLGREPMAGYDLKKRLQESPAMPWSGNNNQVYRALSQLLDEGLVTSELHHQDSLPSRKVYTITGAGRAQLREWLSLPPDGMEPRKPLLAQLLLMDAVGARAADALLERYERELRMEAGIFDARGGYPDGLRGALARLVDDNLRAGYRAELDWAADARAAIRGYVENERGAERAGKENEVERHMVYTVIERGGTGYLRYRAQAERPREMDPTQFVGDCLGERVNRVMVEGGALPEEFFRLGTGLAGEVLQKLGQYHVKAALVLGEAEMKGKFRDMMIEANRGEMFRSFEDAERAEAWLLEG